MKTHNMTGEDCKLYLVSGQRKEVGHVITGAWLEGLGLEQVIRSLHPP